MAPITLRLACLKAVEHQIDAERALMEPWRSVHLAPIPPGARWQGEDDPFPQLYPLGSWGNLVADLRQDIDTLLSLAAAPDERVWTPRDSQAADSQHAEGWRTAAAPQGTDRPFGEAVAAQEASTRRLVALGAASQVVEVWHRLLDFSGEELGTEVLSSLGSLAAELLILGRAPGHWVAAERSIVGTASPSRSAARDGALPFPGSGTSNPTPEPGLFSSQPAENPKMKPDRIGMGIKSLSRWQQEGDAAAFHSSLVFDSSLAAQRFMIHGLSMATGLDLDFDAELVGSMVVLHVPGANQTLSEKHLQFARGVESFASVPEMGLRQKSNQ